MPAGHVQGQKPQSWPRHSGPAGNSQDARRRYNWARAVISCAVDALFESAAALRHSGDGSHLEDLHLYGGGRTSAVRCTRFG